MYFTYLQRYVVVLFQLIGQSTHRGIQHSTFRTGGQRKQSTSTEAKQQAGQPPNEDGAHHFPRRPSRCSLHWVSLHPLPVPCNPSSPACLGTVPPVSLLGHTPCTKQSLLGSTFGRSTPQGWVLLYICTLLGLGLYISNNTPQNTYEVADVKWRIKRNHSTHESQICEWRIKNIMSNYNKQIEMSEQTKISTVPTERTVPTIQSYPSWFAPTRPQCCRPPRCHRRRTNLCRPRHIRTPRCIPVPVRMKKHQHTVSQTPCS